MSENYSIFRQVDRWRTARRFDIGSRDSVLEIGPGHAPYSHADVLVDRYVEYNEERGGTLVRDDRPLLQGDVGHLPFKTNEFDFVIASHVVEHAENPATALAELSRVAHRGYIECPTLFWELFRPTRKYHRWVILPIDERLVFYPKEDVSLPPFGTLFERGGLTASSEFLSLFFEQYQDLFLIKRVWEGDVEAVVEPEDDDLRRFFEGPYDTEMIQRVMSSPPQSHSKTLVRGLAERLINALLRR
jgi:hypothetical protein